MNLSQLLSFKPKEPVPPFVFPRMTDAKLAELIKGITSGKVIQMAYPSSHGWGDMTPRSLEDYLSVFLQPRTVYVNFRVKPEELLTPTPEKFVTRKHQTEMNDKFLNILESHGRQIDALYKLVLNQCNYKLNKE